MRFLQAGCRFDDLYRRIIVEPGRWIAGVLVSEWIDRRILDGVLRAAWGAAGGLGRLLRNGIDRPLIDGAVERIGRGTVRAGARLRAVQTGRVQEYLLFGLIAFAICAAVLVVSMLTGQ